MQIQRGQRLTCIFKYLVHFYSLDRQMEPFAQNKGAFEKKIKQLFGIDNLDWVEAVNHIFSASAGRTEWFKFLENEVFVFPDGSTFYFDSNLRARGKFGSVLRLLKIVFRDEVFETDLIVKEQMCVEPFKESSKHSSCERIATSSQRAFQLSTVCCFIVKIYHVLLRVSRISKRHTAIQFMENAGIPLFNPTLNDYTISKPDAVRVELISFLFQCFLIQHYMVYHADLHAQNIAIRECQVTYKIEFKGAKSVCIDCPYEIKFIDVDDFLPITERRQILHDTSLHSDTPIMDMFETYFPFKTSEWYLSLKSLKLLDDLLIVESCIDFLLSIAPRSKNKPTHIVSPRPLENVVVSHMFFPKWWNPRMEYYYRSETYKKYNEDETFFN